MTNEQTNRRTNNAVSRVAFATENNNKEKKDKEKTQKKMENVETVEKDKTETL